MGLFKKKQTEIKSIYSALTTQFEQLGNQLKIHVASQDQHGISQEQHILSQERYTLILDQHILSLEQHILTLEKASEKSQTMLQKHSMALEDMLDTLQEKEEQDTLATKRINELEQTEDKLLQLNYAYQQNLSLIEQYLTAVGAMDDSWQKQLQLMKSNLHDQMSRCGITEIAGCGAVVNYGSHQVIEAIDTDNPELNFVIAKVYEPGFIYQGKVKVKAQVAAYRLKPSDEPIKIEKGAMHYGHDNRD